MSENKVIMYTDGACRNNPGPGGWGVLLMYNDHEKKLSGAVSETTNNRMELQAAIEGLASLTRRCHVDLYTDSVYVKQGIQTWMPNWKRNGWKSASKKPVKNQDLWKLLDAEVARHEVEWHWVKGHSGNPYNDEADRLATEAINTL